MSTPLAYHQLRRARAITLVAVGLLVLALAGGPLAADEPEVVWALDWSEPVAPTVFDGDLRDLPRAAAWEPGDPIVEIPRRSTHPTTPVTPPEPELDALLALQAERGKAPEAIGAPILNFAGGGFTGVNPPDTVGDAGPAHYIQLINSAGSSAVRVFGKAGTLLAGPLELDNLGSGDCANGAGDPIVLYDQLADRWLHRASSARAGNNLCVYISQTSDPTGSLLWLRLHPPNFPDYPKYGVWPRRLLRRHQREQPGGLCPDSAHAMLAGQAATIASLHRASHLRLRLPDGAAGRPRRRRRRRRSARRRSSCATSDTEAHGSPGSPDRRSSSGSSTSTSRPPATRPSPDRSAST